MTSPLPAPLRPLGPALAAIYRAGLTHRTRRFDRGEGVVTLDRPVISVGNLSVGGTGKSPTVAHVVRTLIDAGHTPAIAMRGYKAVGGLSDEADSYHRALPGVPVIANPDRLGALLRHFATDDGGRTDCIVLDDGFQHRRLARQLDLVLIDATRDPFADHVLPRGFLREPTDALARAGGAIITHADRVAPGRLAELCASIESAGPPVVATTAHAWLGLDIAERSAERTEPVSWLRGKRAAVVTAIGRPESVLASARDATGADPVATLTLPDHDPYTDSTLARIERLVRDSAANVLLVTDKDWSKLRHKNPERFGVPVVRPRLGLAFLTGEDRLADLVRTAAKKDPDDGPVPVGPISAGPAVD